MLVPYLQPNGPENIGLQQWLQVDLIIVTKISQLFRFNRLHQMFFSHELDPKV